MRIMFQPDALHHQAPSNHTRHHHTLSGPPEKTSGFNIPNTPTASLHAQLTTTRPQLPVKLSLLPPRHDTASPPFPTQTPCPPFFTHRPQRSTPSRPFIPNPTPASGWQPSHILLHDARSRDTTNTSHFSHSSLATSLPATPPRPKPSTAISMHRATSAPGPLGSSASCTCSLPSPTDANLYSFTRSHHADHRRHQSLARRIHRPAT